MAVCMPIGRRAVAEAIADFGSCMCVGSACGGRGGDSGHVLVINFSLFAMKYGGLRGGKRGWTGCMRRRLRRRMMEGMGRSLGG